MLLSEIYVHTTFFGFYLLVFIVLHRNHDKLLKSVNPEVKFVNENSYRYYTYWGFGIQLLYYACIVISHFLSLAPNMNKISKQIREFADSVLTTIALPFGLAITSCFWIIYNIDREAVFPSWMDELIPWWLNHALHTFNSVLPILDLLLTKHQYPPWIVSTAYILVYAGAYFILLLDTRLRYGRHSYQFLDNCTNLQVLYLFLLNIVLAFIFHKIVRIICQWRWGTPKSEEQPSQLLVQSEMQMQTMNS